MLEARLFAQPPRRVDGQDQAPLPSIAARSASAGRWWSFPLRPIHATDDLAPLSGFTAPLDGVGDLVDRLRPEAALEQEGFIRIRGTVSRNTAS